MSTDKVTLQDVHTICMVLFMTLDINTNIKKEKVIIKKLT